MRRRSSYPECARENPRRGSQVPWCGALRRSFGPYFSPSALQSTLDQASPSRKAPVEEGPSRGRMQMIWKLKAFEFGSVCGKNAKTVSSAAIGEFSGSPSLRSLASVQEISRIFAGSTPRCELSGSRRNFPNLKRTTPKPCGLGVVWEATNVSLSHAAAVNSSKDFANAWHRCRRQRYKGSAVAAFAQRKHRGRRPKEAQWDGARAPG